MKQHSSSHTFRASLLGLLIGGAAGFALGLLLAPEEGQTMRRRLAFRLDRLADGVSTGVDRALRPPPGSDARRSGDAIVADAEARAAQIRQDIDQLMDEMRRHSGR